MSDINMSRLDAAMFGNLKVDPARAAEVLADVDPVTVEAFLSFEAPLNPIVWRRLNGRSEAEIERDPMCQMTRALDAAVASGDKERISSVGRAAIAVAQQQIEDAKPPAVRELDAAIKAKDFGRVAEIGRGILAAQPRARAPIHSPSL